ncbi:MAG: hypothetical protein ACYDBX_03785 [Patescibacteria group bacterium]
MATIDYSKYIVFDKEHLDEFVPPHLIERLNDTISKINYHLPVTNDYIIIDKKESYAYLIEDIINQYKHKEVDNG